MNGKTFTFIIVLFGTLSIGLVVAVIVLGVLLAGKEDCAPVDPVCQTKECVSAANFILKNMDQSVDPCQDFNLFSCGNFIKTSRIPDDASSVDTFTDLRNNLAYALSDVLAEAANSNDSESTRNAKLYYQSCLDEATIEETGESQLVELIKEVGGWHMLDQSLQVDAQSIYNRLVALRKFGTAPLFSVFVSASPKEPKKYLLRIQQPSVFYTVDKYADAKFATAYKSLMKSMVNMLNTHLNQSSVSDQDIDQVFELEKEMAGFLLTTAERRNQVYKNVTVGQLEVDYPGFQWVDYIVNGLYGDNDKLRQVNVTSQEPILVVDFRYFANFSAIYSQLVQEKAVVLDNFLMWSFVKSKTFYLPKAYRDAALQFDKVNSGTNAIPPRSRSCADDINNKMAYAVGRLYVQNNFDESAKQEASDMIENIRKEFKIIVNQNEWMDEKSKKNALDKADFIDVKVGYPDYTYNNTHLDSLYENYTFDVKTYLKNSMLTMRLSTEEAFLELREPRDPKDWISGPAIVNAFYSSSNNQITFPAGILQAPFYDAKVPKYLNYGGIGMVIGHEITHGFDDQGRKYDKDGVFYADGEEGLWTNQTIEEYNQKAQCIVNQYSNFVAIQVNRTLNGSQTQGENIADNGGIKESFYAYQKLMQDKKMKEPLLPGLNYNQEQLFFINNAQVWCSKMTDQNLINRITTGVHSPGEFRIRGPTSNFAEFARVFKCKANTGNNPANKCTVW